MTHAGHAWAPTGTPGRCLEGVTPGSAGIFSVLSYFVAETPIMFLFFSLLNVEIFFKNVTGEGLILYLPPMLARQVAQREKFNKF